MEEIQQPNIEQENKEKHYELVMVAVFAVVAIPLFSLILGKSLHKQTVTIPPTQNLAVEKQQEAPAQVTIVPVLIRHKQDIDNALKMVDGVETSSVEKQLDQIDANTSSFSQ